MESSQTTSPLNVTQAPLSKANLMAFSRPSWERGKPAVPSSHSTWYISANISSNEFSFISLITENSISHFQIIATFFLHFYLFFLHATWHDICWGGGGPPKVVKFYFRKAARINLATSHRTLHDVDALALEPSAQLVYRLFARVSEVRRDLWVWGKVERALPCRLETKAELQRFALDFFVGRRLMLVCHTQLFFVTLLFAEVVVIFEDVVNSDNFPHIAVCPLIIELLGLKKFVHIFQPCFDWERGVNPCATCMDMFACKLRVSARLKNYVPKCLSFSHNFKQSITIFFKSQALIRTPST